METVYETKNKVISTVASYLPTTVTSQFSIFDNVNNDENNNNNVQHPRFALPPPIQTNGTATAGGPTTPTPTRKRNANLAPSILEACANNDADFLELKGHYGAVNAVKVDKDILFSGSSDMTIGIWGINDAKRRAVMSGHEDVINSVDSDFGVHIVSGSDDCTVRVWDTETRQCVSVLKGHKRWVNKVVFKHGDGNIVYSGSDDCKIKVWDLRAGSQVRSWKAHQNGVSCLESYVGNDDDDWLYSGGADNMLKRWDLSQKEGVPPSKIYEGHFNPVRCVFFSASNPPWLASSSQDFSIKIWEPHGLEAKKTLTGHRGSVFSIASAFGGALVSGASDHTVRIWDTRRGECRAVLRGHKHWVRCVATVPAEAKIVSGSRDQTIRIWFWPEK